MSLIVDEMSLSAQAKALTCAPDVRKLLIGLAETVEQGMAAEAILARAMGGGPAPLASGPRHARRRRDRHGLRVLPGGLAAFAPLGFFAHAVLPAAVATAGRWLWHSARARLVTTVLALGTGAALAIPVSAIEQGAAATAPHPHAIIRVHHHHSAPAPAQQPAALPPPRRRPRHHRHHHRVAVSPSPSPAASSPAVPPPSPIPSPSVTLPPLPTATPTLLPGGAAIARKVLGTLHRLL